MSETRTSEQEKKQKKRPRYPKVHPALRGNYAQYYDRMQAFGRLVIGGMERKKRTIEYVCHEIGMRKVQFLDLLCGTQKTMVLSVEQATRLADLLDLNPVQLLEAYLLDSSHIQLSPVVAHTMVNLYECFQWYRAYLGQSVSDEKVASDVGMVLYLSTVYERVRASDELLIALVKTLNGFMETMQMSEEAQAVEELALGSATGREN